VPVAAVFHIDKEICAGQKLASIGSSGAGMSTVAPCMTRIERPDAQLAGGHTGQLIRAFSEPTTDENGWSNSIYFYSR